MQWCIQRGVEGKQNKTKQDKSVTKIQSATCRATRPASSRLLSSLAVSFRPRLYRNMQTCNHLLKGTGGGMFLQFLQQQQQQERVPRVRVLRITHHRDVRVCIARVMRE